MRRGFTLLELMIVIIILGVLATLGVMQYQAAIEKSRGAEARQIIGQLRSQCAAQYMNDPTGAGTSACDDANMGIGIDIPGPAEPGDCAGTHFFAYDSQEGAVGGSAVAWVASRCSANGKAPQHTGGGTLTLTTDFAAGTDVWSTTGGY